MARYVEQVNSLSHQQKKKSSSFAESVLCDRIHEQQVTSNKKP